MAIARSVTDLAAVTAFPSTPQVTLEFTPRTIMVVNEHATESVDVSFDGTTVHGKLTPGTLDAGMVFEQRVRRVWLRRSSSSGSPTGVNTQVIAES